MPGPDPYEVLGVGADASPDEIRSAFRRAVKQRHPDTSSGRDEEPVRSLIAAYRLLASPGHLAGGDVRPGDDPPTRRQSQVVSERPAVSMEPPRPAKEWCGTCSGAGFLATVATCLECRGSAHVTTVEQNRAWVLRCRPCGGSGRIRAYRRCVRCEGSGMRLP